MAGFGDSNGHSIVTILEGQGRQIFFQNEKGWRYRVAERRWITMHDHSRWRKAERAGDQAAVSNHPVR